MLPDWDELPESMHNDYVRKYYDILKKKELSLKIKRAADVIMAAVLLVVLAPVFAVLAVWIKLDSKGPVLFRQTRVTAFDKDFTIYKFRTMVDLAEQKGSRITDAGKKLRGLRLDELPQLINVLKGDMSFVGTRPEVRKYVDAYTPAMMATLLMPAGITSDASIRYKDEDRLLSGAEDVDYVYTHKVLPGKMKYNLRSLRRFSLINDIYSIYAENKKVYARTKDKKYIVNHRLYELEEILDGNKFVRISNSAIINIYKIENLEASINGMITINFKNGEKEYISRRYLKKVKKILDI